MSSPYCTMCKKPATIRCSSCRCELLYCSKSCQVADWKLHKILCKMRPSFEEPPTPSSRRAILFSTDDISFIWVSIKLDSDPSTGLTWEAPQLDTDLAHYFGGKTPSPHWHTANTGIPGRDRTLRECLLMLYNDNFLSPVEGLDPNRAISRLVPGMNVGDPTKVWRGPLVAMMLKDSYLPTGDMNPAPRYGHMDIGDLRDVVDYLTSWKKNIMRSREEREEQVQNWLNDVYGENSGFKILTL